jgi:hypothetical protein
MSILSPNPHALPHGLLSLRRCATPVQFVGDVMKEPTSEIPTSVEIFEQEGKWYCHVRRGDEKTRSMGPYTKREAERIQDARRLLLAKKGTARLVFEEGSVY